MADEQIIVDIQVDSKDVKTADNRIDKLTDSIEELGNTVKTARDQNKLFKKEQQALNKLYKDGGISSGKYEKEVDKLNAKIKTNNKVIAESSVEMSKQKRERTANIKLVNSETDSLAQLEAKASLLNQAITKQSTATKEGREEYERLNTELGDVNKKVNEQRQAFNDNTKNIGNYKGSIIDAVKELRKQENALRNNIKALDKTRLAIGTSEQEQEQYAIELQNTQTQLVKINKDLKKYGENLEITDAEIIDVTEDTEKMSESIGKVKKSSESAEGGTNSLSKSFKALLANPVVLIISLIVASLAALFGAFKKSESGAKLLEKAGAALNGLMMVLTSVMNTVANALTSAFEDPKQAVIDLWDAIKKNLVNRLEGVVRLFKALVNIDFTDLTASAKELGGALLQVSAGIDEEQLNSMTDGISKMATEAANLAKKMADLAASQRAMRAQSRTLEKDIAVLNAEFERLGEIAGDDTQNMHEMRQAAIDAGKAAAELAVKQEKLAQIRLSTINQEVAVRRSAGEDIQDLLDQQAQAEVALTDARSQAAIAQQKIFIEQRKIERDIFEQNLDILLDVGDKIKTEQEKAIQNESLSLEKRKELLEASKIALAANFGEIKKEYELYGITAEQINEVINASDAKQVNEKLKALGLNEIANNRLREIILERKQVELDFNDLQIELSEEEIERKEAANETIQELNEELALSQIEGAEELKDKLIEFEKARLKILLDDETLLAEEKEAIKLESESKIRDIEAEFADEKKEKDKEDLEQRKEFLQNYFVDLIAITGHFAGEELAIFSKMALGISQAFEDGKITAEGAIQAVGMISNALFDNIAARREKDLSDNEKARARELELAEITAFSDLNVLKDKKLEEERIDLEERAKAGDRDAQFKLAELDAEIAKQEAQAVINEKFDKKDREIKLKQFKDDKKRALVDITIATALAVAKAGILTFQGIATGIAGIALFAKVAATKPPKFAGGTSDIVNIGGSHASGNDTDVWGYSGGKKQYFGKVEKGEAMPVIRKSAVNDYEIAKLNGRFNSSRGKRFAGGTPDITDEGGGQNNEMFVKQMVSALSSINIVAKIEDITKEAGKKIEIVDNSKV